MQRFRCFIPMKKSLSHSLSLSLSVCFSLLYFVCMCFTNDDFMQWMLLTLTLINETVFDDSIMNSYTYFYFHPQIQNLFSCLFIHLKFTLSLDLAICRKIYETIYYLENIARGSNFLSSKNKVASSFSFHQPLQHTYQQSWLMYVTLLPF